jgi:predicted RNA-binding protein Jag
MTRARKYSGKTVDEATEIALAELDAELEDVEIKVVSTGRSGILGFGGEPAEIEISMLGEGGSSIDDDEFEDSPDESSPEPVADRTVDSDDGAPRGRGRTRNRNRGRNRGRGRDQGGRDREEDQQPESVEASSAEPVAQPDSSDQGEPQEERRGRRGGRGSGRDRSRSNDRNNSDGRASRSDARDSSDERPEANQNRRNEDSQPIIREKDEEAEQLVSELIEYFLGAMGVVAETYIREDEEDGSMTFEIEGQDAGLLIGRRGETLQALQFLIRMVTNRQLGRKAYVVIDIEDYRERRVQMLRRLARRTAGRVGSSGREDSLEPMSPAERRIVHMSLAGHPEVRTESEGEGNQRRVVIFPL